MRRLTLLLCALLLALCAAPALAQDPDGEPVDEVPIEETEDDGVLDPDEIPPESTPAPDFCAEDGADGAYDDCRPCPTGADGDYADYAYCEPVPSAGGGGPGAKRREDAVQPLPAAQARQLPLTGHDPLLIGLFGAGFLLTGAGLRIRLRAAPRR